MKSIKVRARPMQLPPGVARNSYPWHTMNVADQFPVRDMKYASVLVATANRRYAPKKWVCRRDHQGRARIWRIN